MDCLKALLDWANELSVRSKGRSLQAEGFIANDALPDLPKHLFCRDQLIDIDICINLARYKPRYLI